MWALDVNQSGHQPVLLDAALAALKPRVDGIYIDATYGRGGHSAALLTTLDARGRLLAIDRDPDACAQAWKTHAGDDRFTIERSGFARLGAVCARHDLHGRVDGLLVDLGVSSPQLDRPERGFSFMRRGPLDMRMDPQSGVSAADWLADAEHGEIARVLREYGEEPFAGRIASAIVEARASGPITHTDQLAELIRAAIPARVAARSAIHPATRSFQALRIYVNDELEQLQRLLDQSLDVLAPGGRLVVISFHSLEDRRVKRFMRVHARPEPPALPMAPAPVPTLRLVGKPHRATAEEVAANPRARSAIMRVAERCASAEQP